jgi:FkbM family methyltransferase
MKTRDLFNETQRVGLPIRSVCEVGVYFADKCSLKSFIDAKLPTTLIEADPNCVQDLEKAFGSIPNVTIVRKAIWHEHTQLKFYRSNASTFAGAVGGSPAEVNDSYKLREEDSFSVDAILFSDVDSGNYDLVLIDVEGAEYNVIQHMKSRPLVISLEMRASTYQNPKTAELNTWLSQNNYRLWFHNDTDSVFIRKDFKVSPAMNLYYSWINLRTDIEQSLKRTKKKLRKKH